MKLANTTHYIACKNDLNRAGRNCPRPTRFTTSRTFNIRRPLTRVVARWHVCPKTHRLECLWSLEPMVCDDQLCRSRTQKTTPCLATRSPGRASVLDRNRLWEVLR